MVTKADMLAGFNFISFYVNLMTKLGINLIVGKFIREGCKLLGHKILQNSSRKESFAAAMKCRITVLSVYGKFPKSD
jgi:hypothetical protein